MGLRLQFGLRSDLEWVREVAITGDSGGMVLGIPLTLEERGDIEGRSERNVRAVNALQEAVLESAAGCWIDQQAGGVLHDLLADPSPADLHAAQAAVADIPAVIEVVATPMSELERLNDQVGAQRHRDPELRAAMVMCGVDVKANTMSVKLRIGTDPAVAARLLQYTGAENVAVEYTEQMWVSG